MRALRIGFGFLLFALLAAVAQAQGHAGNFRAHLSGNEEASPVATSAQGQATFRVLPGGTAIQYRLIVANIEDVRMSHIHLAPAGANGPIVVWLYPSAPPEVLIPGRSDGMLAVGVFTAANLVGPLAGQTIEDLIAHIQAGNAYVNVHTVAFPSGEIRGQIR
ncbi:MAG: CHRD domain-containing protein [Burkholderiales bacterium]|nr:MAG: CHRD domain-containing protein [Burkholderiales bacterium]